MPSASPSSHLRAGDNEAGSVTAWTLVIGTGETKPITVVIVSLRVRGKESLRLTGTTMPPWVAVAPGLLSAPEALQETLTGISPVRAME